VEAIRAGVEDTLAVAAMDLPCEHRRRLHSTNKLERLNRELKKRTRKVSIFPNEASLVRLYGAMLMEIDEGWKTE
jgi:transposase-like protein